MGQDGNTIEIEIDAAATVAAAKTAGEANAKLAKFNTALGLFRDNVDLVTKTTDIVASKIGDFDSLLQKFADNLTSNLADMQTSVVKKVEPHLERELENMVNRVLNKVEGKVAPEKESRSRSEAKQGAAAPAQPVTVAQPPEYKRPDTKVKATFTDTTNQIVDTATGQVKENTSNRARTTATKTRHWQEEVDGEIQDFTETITSVSNSVRKATTAEKDRGLAIRKEITGALIGLHVMKVVSQYSSVFNAGFMQVAAAMGHLLNVVLLPMMPMFTQVAQVIHTLANFVSMLPLPIRQLIGALIMWKATSMLIASMPIKDVRDGFKGIADVMKGAGSGLEKFTRLVGAFIDFMNSGQGKGALSWVAGGIGKVAGKAKGLLGRASGGPVLGHGAYVVGEKGPEIFVPKTSGSIIPNHKAFRAEGGDVTGGVSLPFGGDIMGNLGAGIGVGALAYLMTGSPLLSAGLGAGAGMLGPEGIANGIASVVSSDIGSNFIASINVMTGMLASILAPLAPMMGIVGALAGVVTGARAAGGGGGDGGRTAETVASVGKAQLKATSGMNFGVQNAIGGTGRGTNKVLSMILMRLGGCLNVAPCVPGIFGSTDIIAALALLPGAISVAIGDLAAKIKYTIETIGEKPVVEDVTARITYNVETVGEKPTVTDSTAKVTYTIEKIGTEPVTTNKAATIKYNIETVGTIPAVNDVTAKITYDTAGITLPTTFDIAGKVTSVDLTKIPVELAKVELFGSIKDVKVAEAIKAKPPEIDTRGRIIDAKPSDAIKTKFPEIDISGKVRTIDVTGVDPSKTKIPVDIDPKVPEGFDWKKLFEGAKVDGLKDIGKTGAGLFLVGFALALDEFGRTGKVNWGGLLVGLGTAFVIWTGAEAALVGVATALGGAAAGGAVAGAMGTVGLALIAAMMVPIAANFGGDIMSAIQKAANAGGFTSGMFDNFALKAAFELGNSFQGALNTWLKDNFRFDLNQFITDTSQGQNGWFFDLMQSVGGTGIQLALGPTAKSAFDLFINNLQSTLRGGVPVDVKIDVDSVTSVVEAVRQTAGGTPISGGASVPGEMVGECPSGQYWDRALQACVPISGSVIPSHADGGRVIPNIPNLVGEKGPELFVPDPSPTSVSGSGGGGANVTNHFTFNVTTNNPKELTDAVMRELKLELARVKM